MIKNENQLAVAKRRLADLERDAAEMRRDRGSELWEATGWSFDRDIQRAREEIDLYEFLRDAPRTEQGMRGCIHRLASRENPLRDVSALITQLRLARGLTQEELARRAGWDQPNVSRYESEDYQGHTIAKILEIMNALEVELRLEPCLGG